MTLKTAGFLKASLYSLNYYKLTSLFCLDMFFLMAYSLSDWLC